MENDTLSARQNDRQNDKSFSGYSNDFARIRLAFLHECCVSDSVIAQTCENARVSGLICIHINARGTDNVLSPGTKPILKHVFLQNPRFKNDIVEYYRTKGFSWVDVVVLNRFDWKIFLTPQDPRRDNNNERPVSWQQPQHYRQQQQQLYQQQPPANQMV